MSAIASFRMSGLGCVFATTILACCLLAWAFADPNCGLYSPVAYSAAMYSSDRGGCIPFVVCCNPVVIRICFIPRCLMQG